MRRLLPVLALPLVAACQQQAGPAPVPPPAAPAPASTPAATTPTPTPTRGAAPSATPSPTAPASRSASARPSTGTLVDYRRTAGENGVEVHTEADLAKLTGAPDDFRAFIRAELQRVRAEVGNECNPGVSVLTLRTDGYAVGSTFGCGGAMVAWAKSGGAWRTIWGGQDIAQCAPFRTAGFPVEVFVSLGENCADGGRVVPYRP